MMRPSRPVRACPVRQSSCVHAWLANTSMCVTARASSQAMDRCARGACAHRSICRCTPLQNTPLNRSHPASRLRALRMHVANTLTHVCAAHVCAAASHRVARSRTGSRQGSNTQWHTPCPFLGPCPPRPASHCPFTLPLTCRPSSPRGSLGAGANLAQDPTSCTIRRADLAQGELQEGREVRHEGEGLRVLRGAGAGSES